jgi:hypothetical protein
MKPVDIRNAHWADIEARLDRDRRAVYEAMLRLGPQTTRTLAGLMQWDPFNVRPRVTELYQLRLARLVRRVGKEGVYEAVPIETARREFEAQRQAWAGDQMLMRM